ncbi:MAG: HAMP domain-containing sensor histidine kinase [Longimicrobiales bacterium]|nr:HAMP domain-containing sensor histidine kinase [Longimicrobiales bacterium]
MPLESSSLPFRVTDPEEIRGEPREGMSLALHFAHDIRSPVAAVAMLAEVARDELGDAADPAHRRRLDLLFRAALGLDALVDDLLVLSGQASDPKTEMRPFRVDELLEGLGNALRPAAELWDVSVRISAPVAGMRSGRPACIRHALLNLASLLQRTGEDHVEIGAEPIDDSVVRFSVSTHGRGPDPASIRTVRDVVAGTESRSPACFSHLGTEAAFRLVGSIGSSLEMESVEGGGTRFRFDVDLPEVSSGSGA